MCFFYCFDHSGAFSRVFVRFRVFLYVFLVLRVFMYFSTFFVLLNSLGRSWGALGGLLGLSWGGLRAFLSALGTLLERP